MKQVKVVQKEPPADEIPTEILASAIVAISETMKRLRSGRLNDKGLYLLIQNAAPTIDGSKVTVKEIKAVMEGLASLEATYIKKWAKL